MYDLKRTNCDLFRNRNKMEFQNFNTVLKSYTSRKDKNLNRLMEYAGKFNLQNIIRKYLEILL